MTETATGSHDLGDGLPVVHPDTCRTTELAPGVTTSSLLGPHPGSPLTLEHVQLQPGAAWRLTAREHQGDRRLLVYVLGGACTLDRDGEPSLRMHAGSALSREPGDGSATIVGGDRAPTLAVFGVAPTADHHAPLGARESVAELNLDDAAAATGSRSFQVLLGPENGCCRATMFVGVVPPGAAPWHFHNYDEIICVLRGDGVYHQASGPEPTRPGSVVRIPARTVHINENRGAEEMHVLGVFTPAGSPSAAFLASPPDAEVPDVPAAAPRR
jgi:quercetin dioxygenase-like cupin family protein